jgi:large subunit ribosomal protein L24
MPINISNVALFNPATQKADRVGFKLLDDGRKVGCSSRTAKLLTRKGQSWRACRNTTNRR